MEISRDILNVAMHGAKKTEMVYQANLNFDIIKKYIRSLEEAGMIHIEPLNSRSKLFTTTEKGRLFVKSIEETMNIYQGLTPLGSVGAI